jgi:RNA polymerase sigma factor for flagellar operon FliA
MALGLSDEVLFDDLLSSGVLGLIRALDNYDAGHGTAFSTYAVPKIRGAILDDLRSNDPASRTLRRREREVREARRALGLELGRDPSEQEIADRLGVDIRLYWRWMESLRALKTLPIDRPVAPGGDEVATLGEIIADPDADELDAALLQEERREIVAKAIQELKAQERTVLALYYYEDLKQAEIAEVLGVSESRVSQIRSKAIRTLRQRFELV